MPPIPTKTKLPRFYKRYPGKIKAPPIQPGHKNEYSGKTTHLRKPLKQARLGAKMVSRAVRTSFKQTLPRTSKIVGRIVKSTGKALAGSYKRLREAGRSGLGAKTTRVGSSTGLSKMKPGTRRLLGQAREHKGMSSFQRKNLANLYRDSRKAKG